MPPRLPVDLSKAPAERWGGLSRFESQARELTDSYVKDLGGLETFGALVEDYRQAFVSSEYDAEMNAIARAIGRRPEEVLLANLYYDAFRAFLGCTAFALDTPEGPIHARNLDWWTENDILSDYTLVVEYDGGRCPGPYKSVSWPGFIGVFSAVAAGRFAVTLNAVISEETPLLAQSITLLLRSVFDTATHYDQAVKLLSETPIAADCLLLVTGTKLGEMVVIERTSSRAAIREATNGVVVVTNDYRAMNAGLAPTAGNQLQATACSRFDRAASLASGARPTTAADCLAILQDSQVKMGITVQHMVMQASTGLLEVRLPTSGRRGE